MYIPNTKEPRRIGHGLPDAQGADILVSFGLARRFYNVTGRDVERPDLLKSTSHIPLYASMVAEVDKRQIYEPPIRAAGGSLRGMNKEVFVFIKLYSKKIPLYLSSTFTPLWCCRLSSLRSFFALSVKLWTLKDGLRKERSVQRGKTDPKNSVQIFYVNSFPLSSFLLDINRSYN